MQKNYQLKNTILHISQTFTNTTYANVGSQLVADVCQAINTTVKEIYNIMEEKACQIEEFIQMLPSMGMLDKFAVKGCGLYCLKDCDYGFPNLILREIKDCLSLEER